MDYSRQAQLARTVLARYGGPARIKHAIAGDYDPATDAPVRSTALLAASLSTEAVSLSLTGDLSGFPQSGLLVVGSERIFYSRMTDGVCAGLERGAEGSLAASHDAEAVVTLTHACQETTAVALNYRRELADGRLSEPGDRLIYLATGLTPLVLAPVPGDLLRLGGREYRLEEVVDLAPDGETSVYYEARGRAQEDMA